MTLALTFLCNSQIYLIELSSGFTYSHGSFYAVPYVCSMISLYSYLIPCMIR
jgi:hypothetical protein